MIDWASIHFSWYMIPPALSLAAGLAIAILSITMGRRTLVNWLFAIFCFWWVLIMPVFLSHFIFKGNTELILKIERSVHFLYVYLPAIGVLYAQALTGFQNRKVVLALFLLSFILSLLTPTHWYMTGMWEFDWGYMAKGGIAFQVFGIYCLAATLYTIVLFARRIRIEQDPIARMKLKYLIYSMIIICFLTIGNLPACNGIDLYPPGTMIFIPLLILTWGIFRHEVLRINLYARRRIVGSIVKIGVVAGLVAMLVVTIWALFPYDWRHILSGTIPYGIPPLLSLVICVLLTLVGLKLGENQRETLLFSILMLFYSFLSLDVFLNGIVTDPAVALRISRLDHLFVIFMPSVFLHLATRGAGVQGRNWVIIGAYCISICILPFTQTDWYLAGQSRLSWGFFAKKGVLFDLLSGFGIVIEFYTILLLAQHYRRERFAFGRHRLRYLLLGIISSGALVLGNIPAMNGIDIYPSGNFIFIPAVFLAIGMFRYNLGGLIDFAKEALRYLGLAFAVLLIIMTIETLPLLRERSGEMKIAVGILLFMPAKYVWSLILEKLFLNRSEALKRSFALLSADLSLASSYQGIQENITDVIFRCIGARTCLILRAIDGEGAYTGASRRNAATSLPGNVDYPATAVSVSADHPLIPLLLSRRSVLKQSEIEEWLLNSEAPLGIDDTLRTADIVIPVFSVEQLVAIILLGPKTDGTIYTADELDFASRISLSLGPHLANIRILEQLENTVRERTDELRTSEEKYRLIVENIEDIIYISDWRGNFKFMSPAGLKRLGYSAAEIAARHYLDLIPDDHKESVFLMYSTQLRKGNDETFFEFPAIRKDGSIIWVEQFVKRVKGKDGSIEFYCIARDITERKKTEDVRRELQRQKDHYLSTIARELETARLLQERLLPDSSLNVTGYAMHAAYIPMEKVGGDFYDYRVSGGNIELFIADVSGHGLPGAFLSTIVKMALDHVADRSSPVSILAALNRVVRRTTVQDAYITAFCCLIDMETNRMRFASAGHLPPVLHRRGGGGAVELAAKGRPLGWFDDPKLLERQVVLAPGDRLVLHTDGISECMNESRELFGEERFYAFIDRQRELSPAAFCDELVAHIRTFASSESFEDDFTLVVFDVLGKNAP